MKAAGTRLAAGVLLLLAAACALCLLRVPSAERPQSAHGDDALAVAFGDARQTISAALLHKADIYFHGGVDMDGHHHCELDDHDHCDHDHCDHDGHPPAQSPHPQSNNPPHPQSNNPNNPNNPTIEQSNHPSLPDPWRWINDRVRAPQVERHLEGARGVEMIPVLWASVRADPKNLDAWTTACYIANTTMKDRDLAARILDEGLRLNPDEPELLFTRARLVLDGGKGDRTAARTLMLRAMEVLRARCGGDVSKLSSEQQETKRHLELFLKSLR